MPSSLQVVTEHFPLLAGQVRSRFEHDELFRELCQDYETCLQALQRLGLDETERKPLRKEYAALRLRLETELLGYLQETKDPGPQ